MFADVVALYRAAARPAISGSRFTFMGYASPDLKDSVSKCEKLNANTGLGHFADGPDYENEHLEFTWALSSNEHGRFYNSLIDFVDHCESIHRGHFPESFYIAELDYFSRETPSENTEELSKINCLCELIRLLGNLSIAGNLATQAGQSSHLIFVKPASSGSAPITVEVTTNIDQGILARPQPNLDVLRDLLSDEWSGKVRTEEYKAIFRLAIASACLQANLTEERFGVLLDQWDNILRQFRHDVECLVDRLSFEGLRREIIEAEINFVGRANTTIIENATKFLGIPISLVAVAAVAGGNSIGNDIIICAGSIIVTLVISGVSKAVRLQIETTTTAFDYTLKAMRNRATADGDIAESLNHLEKTYKERRKFAQTVIATFQVLAWLPPILSTGIILWKFF